MRKIAVVLLLYTAFQANCQEYQVLHVKGEIVRVDDGSLLKPGDKITGEKQIRFKINRITGKRRNEFTCWRHK